MIVISPPTPEDAEQVNVVIKASWYATYINDDIGVTREDIDAMYADAQERQVDVFRKRAEHPTKDDISLVAKEHETVLGFIRLKIHADSVELVSLYVHPDHAGKGIGTALWQEALKLLHHDKPVTVELASYTKAKDFYEKIGFVDTGERFTKSEDRMLKSGTLMPLMKMVFNKKSYE